jgi:hypothetical protein
MMVLQDFRRIIMIHIGRRRPKTAKRLIRSRAEDVECQGELCGLLHTVLSEDCAARCTRDDVGRKYLNRVRQARSAAGYGISNEMSDPGRGEPEYVPQEAAVVHVGTPHRSPEPGTGSPLEHRPPEELDAREAKTTG